MVSLAPATAKQQCPGTATTPRRSQMWRQKWRKNIFWGKLMGVRLSVSSVLFASVEALGIVVAKTVQLGRKYCCYCCCDTGSKWERTVKSRELFSLPPSALPALIGEEGTPGTQRGAAIGWGWKLWSYQRLCHSPAWTGQGSRFRKFRSDGRVTACAIHTPKSPKMCEYEEWNTVSCNYLVNVVYCDEVHNTQLY